MIPFNPHRDCEIGKILHYMSAEVEAQGEVWGHMPSGP